MAGPAGNFECGRGIGGWSWGSSPPWTGRWKLANDRPDLEHSSSSYRGAVCSTPLVRVVLLTLPPQLDMLVTQFINEDAATLPIVHVPSFRDCYSKFNRTNARTEPFFVAFLFAISGWSTYFKTTDPRTPRSGAAVKEGTAKTYLNAAMEALHVGG